MEQRHSDGREGGRERGTLLGGLRRRGKGRGEGDGSGGRRQQSSVQRRRRVDQEIAQEEESPPFIFYPALALLPLPSPPFLPLSPYPSAHAEGGGQGLANFRDREILLK